MVLSVLLKIFDIIKLNGLSFIVSKIFGLLLTVCVVYLNFVSLYVLISLLAPLFGFKNHINYILYAAIGCFIFILFAKTSMPLMIKKQIFTRRLSQREFEYIKPIFDEVYNKAQANGFKKCKIDIRVMVGDAGNRINAYALGVNTLLLTGAFIRNVDIESMKGVIAHELGHLYNGDSKKRMFLYTMNCLTLVVFYIALLIDMVNQIMRHIPFVNFVAGFVSLFIFATMYLINKYKYVINYFLLCVGKNEEYRADKYAKNIGDGNGLIKYLDTYAFKEINNFFVTHPHTEFRIEALLK